MARSLAVMKKSNVAKGIANEPASIDELSRRLAALEDSIIEGRADFATAAQRIADLICCAPGLDGAIIATLEVANLRCRVAAGADIEPGAPLPLDSHFFSDCIFDCRTVRCDDSRLTAVGKSSTPFLSGIALPLKAKGSCMGLLAAFSMSSGAIGLELLTLLGSAAALASHVMPHLIPAQTPDPEGLDQNFTPKLETTKSDTPQKSLSSEEVDALVSSLREEFSPSTMSMPAITIAPKPVDVSPTPAKSRQFRTRISLACLMLASTLVFAGMKFAARSTPSTSPNPAMATKAKKPVKNVTRTVSVTCGKPQLASAGGTSVQGGDARLKPDPVYPLKEGAEELEGEVHASLLVSQRGTVEEISNPTGDPVLVDAATRALAHWRFSPAYVDGRPAMVRVPVTVSFRLKASEELALSKVE